MSDIAAKHPLYTRLTQPLQETADAYGGMMQWRRERANFYLPRSTMEPLDSWSGRLGRSRWASFYRQAVNGFAGILSEFALSEDAILQSETPEYENVDGLGTNLKKFLLGCDTWALRDGWCAVVVDFPDRGEVQSALDERLDQSRPYLLVVERKDVINWRVREMKLDLVVIRRLVESYQEYATNFVEQFWEYFPGGLRVWQGGKVERTVTMTGRDGRPLDRVPIVFYPFSDLPDWEIQPPLHDLALDNFAHYQELSDYREVRYKCNLPVPVRKGFWQSGGENPPPLVLGANSCIDVPVDGDFFFREPSGVAIAATREAILDLEGQMLRRSLAFFGSSGGGDAGGQMTVDEVNLRSSQTRSQLMVMASQKESAVQSIFKWWASWLGKDNGGKISVNRSAMRSPLSPDAIRVFSDMVISGLLSRESFLSILDENGAMPEGFDLSKELEMADKDAEEKMARAIEMSQVMESTSPSHSDAPN